jgi:hypothetical protein
MADAMVGAMAALAGVLVTGTFGLIMEKRRRQWEDYRRWQDQRRDAYAEILYAARRTFGLQFQVIENLARKSTEERLLEKLYSISQELDSWSERLHRSAADASLIASDSVEGCISDLLNIYLEMTNKLTTVARTEHVDLDALWNQLRDFDARHAIACIQFRNEARADLGLTSSQSRVSASDVDAVPHSAG